MNGNFSYTIIFEEFNDTINNLLNGINELQHIYVLNQQTIPNSVNIHRCKKDINNYVLYIEYIINNSNTDYFIFVPKNVEILSNDVINTIDNFFNKYNEYDILVVNSNNHILSKNTYTEYFNGIIIFRKEIFSCIPLTYVENENINYEYFSFLLYKTNYKNYLISNENVHNTYIQNKVKIVDGTDYSIIIPFKNNFNILEKYLWDIQNKYTNINIILVDELSNNKIYDINNLINKFDNIKYIKMKRNTTEVDSIENGIDNSSTKYIIFYENILNIDYIEKVIDENECSLYKNMLKINKDLYDTIIRSYPLENDIDILFILFKVNIHFFGDSFDINNFSKTYKLTNKTKKIIYNYIS